MEKMTNIQFNSVLKMISVIIDDCKNIDEAKEKIAKFICNKEKLANNELEEISAEAAEFKQEIKRIIEWCAKKGFNEKDTLDLIRHIIE